MGGGCCRVPRSSTPGGQGTAHTGDSGWIAPSCGAGKRSLCGSVSSTLTIVAPEAATIYLRVSQRENLLELAVHTIAPA